MGCFWRSESHWTKHNTMRVLILLLLCTLVVTGVATAETIRTMNTLAYFFFKFYPSLLPSPH